MKRKNYRLDEAKIRKVKRLLKAKTETEAVQKAIDIILSREDFVKVCMENTAIRECKETSWWTM